VASSGPGKSGELRRAGERGELVRMGDANLPDPVDERLQRMPRQPVKKPLFPHAM
jgi:hypothetical protein